MATYIVNTTADSVSTPPAGSLREAIQLAGANPGADTIVFALPDGATITLADDLPPITDDLVIDGSGAPGLTISGATLYRVFWAGSGVIEIRDLNIADGLAQGGNGGYGTSNGAGAGGGGGGLGGGLFVDDGVVTLARVTFTGNAAIGGDSVVRPGLSSSSGGGGGGMDAPGGDPPPGTSGGGGPLGGLGGTAAGGAGGDFSGGGGGGLEGYNGGGGGFGGGGGGGGTGPGSGNRAGGDGGFGGGGGGGGGGAAGGSGGSGGLGGYGGGGGSLREAGGGAGLGGAVFVRLGGSISLEDVTFTGSSVAGGAGYQNGSAEGANLFLMGGAPLTYAVSAGETRTLTGGLEADNATIELTKAGEGTLVLAAGGVADFGPMTVADGVLQIDRALSVAVTVQNGGTLAGTGAAGAVTVEDGGTLAPGASPGVLSVGDLTLLTGATLEVELGGTGAGQFDRLNVTGTVTLGAAFLDIVLYGGFTPAAGQSFLLIDNDGSDAVSGGFSGFADDVAVAIGGLNYTVDYQGGDGNDVVLTVSAIPAPAPQPAPAPVPTVGGSGNDLAILNDAGTSYSAGDGDDRVMADGGDDFVHGNTGNDTLHGGSGDDSMHGGQGNDVLYGDDGDDVLFGDKGDDFIHGGKGDDVIDGGEGSDALAGGQGNDVIRGGDGDDILSGDRGNDTLVGGAGADVFRFAAGGGADVVLDFSAAEGDRVQVTGSYALVEAGPHLIVDLGGGDTITLLNVQLAGLPEGWIFG